MICAMFVGFSEVVFGQKYLLCHEPDYGRYVLSLAMIEFTLRLFELAFKAVDGDHCRASVSENFADELFRSGEASVCEGLVDNSVRLL